MTITYASRETGRTALAVLFASELCGSGKPVQEVFDYNPNTLESKTPVLIVCDHATALRPQGMGSKANLNHFQYEVLICTIRESTVDGWDPREAQNAHSTIEAGVRKVVAENRNTSNWMNLHFVGQIGNEFGNPSIIIPAKIGGESYDVETILLECEVNDLVS